MSKIAIMLISAILVLSLGYVIPSLTQSVLPFSEYAYAQEADVANSSPVVEVIVIGNDTQGNVTYIPNNLTIKVGDEIFVLNNGTDTQSVTNGMGPDDPLAGKFFDTGPIRPKGFAEFVVSNLSPGNYTFYSSNSTSTKGFLILGPES